MIEMIIGFGIVWIIICILLFVGWVFNIIKLIKTADVNLLSVLRVLGIFIPLLGSILGFIG